MSSLLIIDNKRERDLRKYLKQVESISVLSIVMLL